MNSPGNFITAQQHRANAFQKVERKTNSLQSKPIKLGSGQSDAGMPSLFGRLLPQVNAPAATRHDSPGPNATQTVAAALK